ncbi:MAG: 2-hydroxyacid dehydrogenase, partial [Clostridia bacterium]|nr:2-hydroxyacid dehydrogenase [Clostridia bacterium]
MNVIAYDIFQNLDDVTYTDIDTICRQADIISLHCPLTADTKHLICKETIDKMKKGVFILNTSRGALIDAEALLAGIKSRLVGAACLDVYEEESELFFEDRSGHIVEDDTLARLISMPNVLLTSHQAFLTEEALSNIAETTVQNIVDLMRNGHCENELTADEKMKV